MASLGIGVLAGVGLALAGLGLAYFLVPPIAGAILILWLGGAL